MDLAAEQQLIADIRNEPAKFSLVFDAYYTLIFRYIFHRVTDYDVARDIASETFLKAFLHFASFHWKGISISFWLYRIATNEIRQYCRRRKYAPQSLDYLLDSSGWDRADPQTTHEEKLALEQEMRKHDDFRLIQKKMQQLPLHYQEVLVLRYFEQKSVKEVALILHKQEGTVKSLLSRGIEKLKKMR